jgi:hypothetical protein
VIGTDGSKSKVQRILHSNTPSNKPPKITSQTIIADENFLYVPVLIEGVQMTHGGGMDKDPNP